jgi:hypothetical protein
MTDMPTPPWHAITIELDAPQWDSVLDIMRGRGVSAEDVVSHAVILGLNMLGSRQAAR